MACRHSFSAAPSALAVALALALTLTWSAGAGGPALAGPTEYAELTRLSDELRDRVAQSRWDAADAMFRRMLAVRGGHLDYVDYWRGFLAAQALGDAIAEMERLDAAVAIQASAEALSARAMLMAWYGRVDIRISARIEPRPPLEMLDIPFEADQRRVLEAATAAVARDGRYAGLLPLGMYKLGSVSFEILGQDQPVVVKVKR